MNKKAPKTTEQWIELFANEELPAITSTVKMLDKFSNDDKSSLPKLSKAILHDQALTSCLLKVANNAQHMGVNKVTTVSRATVILGIKAVKNICLTAKLVDSLLESKSLDFRVYEKLMQLMANSFFAGMLAKMMVPNYSEETQEEVYLAGLLYGIGETAFWSSGGTFADHLVNSADINSPDFIQYCEKEIGSSFSELSRGLANTWNLSDLLIKALDQPQSRTNEVKVIYFADKLSTAIAQPGGDKAKFNDLLTNIASVMKITVSQLKVRITHTKQQAEQLLISYGAEVLVEFLKDLPLASHFSSNQSLASIIQVSKEKAVLETFISLTKLMQSSRDINKYLQTALQGSAKAFKFDRCSFLMFSDDKSQVKSRFVYNLIGEKESVNIALHLRKSENVITRVIETKVPALINDYTNRQWRDLVTKELVQFIDEGVAALIPVKIGNKVIGVICAQRFVDNSSGKTSVKLIKKQVIATDDFQQLCALIEHLNMCLTMIMTR